MPDKGVPKPSHGEDEYFTLEDAEKKRRMALQAKKQMATAEAKRLKDLHFMHCPKCGMEMHEVPFRKLDVDVCFACGGVFLDKGEIDLIAHPQQKGIMAAILNWFKEETKAPGKK
jgi:Zn-finger nucleic acid-binding protein